MEILPHRDYSGARGFPFQHFCLPMASACLFGRKRRLRYVSGLYRIRVSGDLHDGRRLDPLHQGERLAVRVLVAGAAERIGPADDRLARPAQEGGKIKGRVAAINIGIELGVEMAKAFANLAPKAGLDLVFNKSYPPDVQDLQPLLREVMATEPDAFFSFSYPPDTFLVTGQAQQLGFSPELFYVLIGGVFPGYRDAFGATRSKESSPMAGRIPMRPAMPTTPRR